MKHWKFNIALLFIGWPAIFADYLYAAFRSGFETGMFLYKACEDDGMNDFKAEQKGKS